MSKIGLVHLRIRRVLNTDHTGNSYVAAAAEYDNHFFKTQLKILRVIK